MEYVRCGEEQHKTGTHNHIRVPDQNPSSNAANHFLSQRPQRSDNQ